MIPADKLPDNIKDIPDDILNWAIECEITKKPFRIIKPELEFYRKHNLGVPKRHPDQRHLDRIKLRNPRKLFDRKCYKCEIDMKTTYSPEREEVVYCESCYASGDVIKFIMMEQHISFTDAVSKLMDRTYLGST
jgi:hypothetical protein